MKDYVINRKYLVPARAVLVGRITFDGCALPKLHRKLLVVAVNAYLLDPHGFLPVKHLRPVIESIMGKYNTANAYKAKAYYDFICDLVRNGDILKLQKFKAFKKYNTPVCNMKVDNGKSRKVKKSISLSREVDLYKNMYSSLVNSLIEQQQKESKEYFDNCKPYQRQHDRRFDYKIPKQRTTDSFITELRFIYGDDYEYSSVSYVNTRTLVTLACKKHNHSFSRTAANLLKGVGCPLCRKESGKTWADVVDTYDLSRKNDRWTTDRFIQESKDRFGDDTFDYSLCNYVNSKTPVILIRQSDGKDMRVVPSEHLRHGSYDDENRYYKGKTDQEKIHYIVKRIKEILDQPVYVPMQHIENSTKYFRCICPVHGEFNTSLKRVRNGIGCPDCKGNGESIGERNIRKYLSDLSISFVQEYYIKNKRYFENSARVDFYLPKLRVFIEFNGEQHYGIGNNRITHDSKSFEEQLRRDANLRLYAKDKGIELIEVPYIYRNNVATFLDRYNLHK